jgi:hypothetical protein
VQHAQREADLLRHFHHGAVDWRLRLCALGPGAVKSLSADSDLPPPAIGCAFLPVSADTGSECANFLYNNGLVGGTWTS